MLSNKFNNKRINALKRKEDKLRSYEWRLLKQINSIDPSLFIHVS